MSTGDTSFSRVSMKIDEEFGVSSEVQLRIGSLVILCSMIEHRMETLLLTMRGESVVGRRPSTDGLQASATIAAIAKESEDYMPICADIFSSIAAALKDLFNYRNALVHGFPLPAGGGMAKFNSNMAWHGEVRKRKPNIAHVDSRLVELVVQGAANLHDCLGAATTFAADQNRITTLGLLNTEGLLRQARSLVSEVAQFPEFMNQDKT